jgi:hypothetical protein
MTNAASPRAWQFWILEPNPNVIEAYCCVARPEAGFVANRLAVTGCSRAISGAPKGHGARNREPGGDAHAAGRAAR